MACSPCHTMPFHSFLLFLTFYVFVRSFIFVLIRYMFPCFVLVQFAVFFLFVFFFCVFARLFSFACARVYKMSIYDLNRNYNYHTKYTVILHDFSSNSYTTLYSMAAVKFANDKNCCDFFLGGWWLPHGRMNKIPMIKSQGDMWRLLCIETAESWFSPRIFIHTSSVVSP